MANDPWPTELPRLRSWLHGNHAFDLRACCRSAVAQRIDSRATGARLARKNRVCTHRPGSSQHAEAAPRVSQQAAQRCSCVSPHRRHALPSGSPTPPRLRLGHTIHAWCCVGMTFHPGVQEAEHGEPPRHREAGDQRHGTEHVLGCDGCQSYDARAGVG